MMKSGVGSIKVRMKGRLKKVFKSTPYTIK